jgi:hypothetical protein
MDAGPRHYPYSGNAVDFSYQLSRLQIETGLKMNIDITGGEPLDDVVFPITMACLEILGPERCTVSTTGVPLNDVKADVPCRIHQWD